MKLSHPFIISARLLPALKIGQSTLHLEDVTPGSGNRDRAYFILDLPDGTEYTDSQLQSGCGGFRTTQDIFATFLCFLEAAAESYKYRMCTGKTGENEDLFPSHVVEWAAANEDEIGMLRYDIEETEELLIEE